MNIFNNINKVTLNSSKMTQNYTLVKRGSHLKKRRKILSLKQYVRNPDRLILKNIINKRNFI